jgi:RimJ/RimL family protein N-acetyltransferase
VLIEEFDGAIEPDRVLSCFRILEACRPVDQPDLPAWSLESFSAKWGQGFDSNPRERWFGTSPSGEPIGCYLLTLPDRDNTSQAMIELMVAPEHRRAGAGTELLAHAASRARQAGRIGLRGSALDGNAGPEFAAAAGAKPGILDMMRVLRVDDALAGRIAALRPAAEAKTAGYTLLAWAGVTPDEYLDQTAAVHTAMEDMPRDEGMEPPHWDAERIRRMEEVSASHGVTFYSVAARCDQTGEFAAITQVCTDVGDPSWGIQQITAVTRAHRGHSLGLLVKIGMLELLAERTPEVTRVVTGNAGSNQHMIAINEQLGFEVTHTSRSWELDLTA